MTGGSPMRFLSRGILIAALVAASWGMPARAVAVTYSLVDLGVLSGTTESLPTGVNANRQVTGVSYDAANSITRAFLYSGGILTNIGGIGGSTASGAAINALGHIAGDATTTGDLSIAGFFDDGSMHGILTGSAECHAVALNGVDQVVGYFRNGARHAFIYSGGVATDIHPSALATHSAALAINGSGQIA